MEILQMVDESKIFNGTGNTGNDTVIVIAMVVIATVIYRPGIITMD